MQIKNATKVCEGILTRHQMAHYLEIHIENETSYRDLVYKVQSARLVAILKNREQVMSTETACSWNVKNGM